eukprot:5395916-Pyramimonas_sp.AAC.1
MRPSTERERHVRVCMRALARVPCARARDMRDLRVVCGCGARARTWLLGMQVPALMRLSIKGSRDVDTCDMAMLKF